MITILALVIFVVGYLGITLEHNLKVNKSAIALAVGGGLWVLAALISHEAHIDEALIHTGAEIFELVMFLLAAMSLVEVLVHHQFFDIIKAKIAKYNLNDKKQFLLVSIITFFLSGVIDNLTATLVMLLMAKQFFHKENLLVTAASIVVAANAGGAFSPLGDVTTIMLWLAGKFGTFEIILRGFIPSLVMFGVTTSFLYRKIANGDRDQNKEEIKRLTRSEKLVIGLTFGSFSLPLFMSFIGLPPYIGLLLGLGVVWLATDVFRQISKRKTFFETSIDSLIQKTDIASLKFFVGILLAVSALEHLGLLEKVAHVLYGEHPAFERVIVGNVILGMVSAVLDNVPLTAIAINVLHTDVTALWILLALTVGTGGSLLIVGSAAGVVCMGSVKELNFTKYIKIAFLPVLIGYFSAVLTWYIQYNLFIKP